MTPQQFEYLQTMLKERSGLVLGNDKRYLIESRLGPVAKKNNIGDIGKLIETLKRPGQEALRRDVTEAMTVNESFFFRDKVPFKNFEEVMIPHFREARRTQRKLRIWSAAASTGQEAYSLSICTKEQSDKMAGWNIEITGTDLSSEVLEKAKSGLYSQFEVQRGIPAPLLVKYFKQSGTMWQIDSALKAMVKFRTFNLLDEFRALGTFDVVFCRNVLIYFDTKTKANILERISKQLAPDGYLVLGAAETIVGLTTSFKPVADRRGLYQLSSYTAGQSKTAAATLGTRAVGSRLTNRTATGR